MLLNRPANGLVFMTYFPTHFLSNILNLLELFNMEGFITNIKDIEERLYGKG